MAQGREGAQRGQRRSPKYAAVSRNQYSGRIFITFCLCVANEGHQACGPGEEGHKDLGSGIGGYPGDGLVARFQQLTLIPRRKRFRPSNRPAPRLPTLYLPRYCSGIALVPLLCGSRST